MARLSPTEDEKRTGTLFAFVVMNASSYDPPSISLISGNPFSIGLYGVPIQCNAIRGRCREHYGVIMDPYTYSDCYECAVLEYDKAADDGDIHDLCRDRQSGNAFKSREDDVLVLENF